jgi:hypothetical protein
MAAENFSIRHLRLPNSVKEKNDVSSVRGVGCHSVRRFPGLPPSLAPWTGAPCSRTFAYMG